MAKNPSKAGAGGGCGSVIRTSIWVLAGVLAGLGVLGYAAYTASEQVLAEKVAEGTQLQLRQPGAKRGYALSNLHLLWCDGKLADKAARKAALLGGGFEAKAVKAGVEKLEVYVDDPENDVKPTCLNIDTISGPQCGMVWAQGPGSAELGAELSALGFGVATYLTNTSVYTDYGEYAGPAVQGWEPRRGRDWERGTRSPYVGTVTSFPMPERWTSRSDWVEQWHSVQGPMSEMIQPRARYVRNVVVAALTPGAPKYGGVVVEMWPSVNHMENPFYFFHASGPWELCVHFATMMRSVLTIMDFTRIQGATFGEYILK